MDSNQVFLETIYIRNEFFRKKFHFALGVLTLCFAGIILLSCMLMYLIKHPPHPMYFVANPIGQLLQDTSVSSANMSMQEISDWVVEGVEKTYSYSFINYRYDLQNAQKYFTEYGWKQYMKGLTKSNNLVALTQRRQIVIARAISAPQLIGEGTVGGAHAWKFRLQVGIKYWMPPYDDSPNSQIYNLLDVTVVAQRQNLLTSYKGLGIIQMYATILGQNAPPPQPETPTT